MRCCQTSATCLIERQRAMRLDGPFGWQIPCMDCIEGCARQMDRHTPEPDIAPSPQRDLGKPRVKRPNATCATCGKKVTRGAKQCKPCRGKARTAAMPKKCTVTGCRCKARRGTLCCTHYYATVAADKLERKRERSRVADARYKERRVTP